MASFVIATTPSLAGPVAAADRNATVAAAAAAGSGSNVVVTPGDVVHVEGDYLRGHGTYNARATQPGVPGSLLASVAGSVERVNKLVSVRVPRHRYVGEVGDVVVGRIVSVGQRSWRVDIGARQTAVLQLSSVTLPGGAQRRRTQEDRLAMRSFLREGDLISAEVQTLYQRDGTVALHTRSLKYGKLENGCLAVVPAGLIKRLKHHFVSLPCGVDVVLGRNGYLWVSETDPAMAAAARSRNSEAMQQSREVSAPFSPPTTVTLECLAFNSQRTHSITHSTNQSLIYLFAHPLTTYTETTTKQKKNRHSQHET